MSISVSKTVNLAQAAVKFLVQDEIDDEPQQEYRTIGGVFSDTDYAWLSNGPRLEVVHTKTGCKVGAWTFGWVLKDSNTQVVCVEEIQRPHGRLPLLAVAVDCDFSGGMLCIFDFITSKVIRAIQIRDKITTLHVVDAGYDVFTLPGPLRNFDGIIAVGTAGGDVFLIDICRQICDEALTVGGLIEIRDELNPCQLNNITSQDISRLEFHKEFAVRNSQHLAIHLNVVLEQSTRHFTLKGPKGDDRIHVNKDEVTVSALYYCPQLGSLLIGYNFGALQLYNLMNLELVYTSPVCDEHIPISHFAVQEPADDPRAFCYVWAVYSANDQYPTCLPLAVMYAFCYHTKEYHEGYGFLYQDFNTAAVHYQMELGVPQEHKRTAKPRGGYCLMLNSINQGPVNKGPHHDSNEDSLTLCALVWNVCFNNKEIDTFTCLFDLNQWYKEQMPPSAPNAQYCPTFMIQMPISNLINSSTNKSIPVIDVHIDRKSVRQFTGAQRLEEHFCPNSISFEICSLRASDIIHIHNLGVQKALLAQIESSGPLCLVEPAEMYQEIVSVGLIPLFIDLPVNTPITTNQQREMILGTALENQLMGWLCKCASEWANGSYLSTGCSLDLLITWAFQRAVALKTNCDNFCVPLFDHSETRLDNNTNTLLNSCTRQLKNLCSLYAFIIRKLYMFISNQELVNEQFKSLEMVSVYFEVLQWLLNVGLLPECPLSAYPRSDDMERINAPYPAEMLSDFYNHRRGLLKILNEENFSSSDSVLFIDTLIEKECGGKTLQEQWRNDGGNGLYPPPSLQSLLRTYLIDNVDLSYKHSVIIYVFLDLAVTLDQARYKPVITYLIKFPAVFKASPSLIKITQAFWQLDHGDYNTAMGLLLDPLILNNDLSQWHHKVALRSLLLQKQHNFALLYVQVRKPTFKDDEDVMTAISLYVANNLLDEAFYFEKRFVSQPNGDKFLLHLFKECTKNDKIRSIIYRSLTTAEENCFLKYLLESKHPSAEDLHVYYHILRSHYIEAFESHDRSVPNRIENQGLIGQESAIPRDKLVYSLKKLLPDVTRNLLHLCQKEKNSIWQQVSKPAPMTVLVHNLNDRNVQYKSSSIGVALSKAKQTFNETLNDTYKIKTEQTPFLRTPRTSTISKRTSKVVITPRFLDTDQIVHETLSPTPAKRLKLSPRLSSGSFSSSVPSKLDTPLVKRKASIMRSVPEQQVKIATPHSILKVKSDDTNQFEDDFKTFEKLEYTPVASKKTGLGLSPRKSLAKPSPVVRFEGLKSSSSSSLNASRNLSDKLADLSSSKPSPNSSYVQRLSGSSKNTSTEEEIFYSPDNSIQEATETNDKVLVEVKDVQEEEKVSAVEEAQADDKIEMKETKASLEEENASPMFSPKGRRSYKRALGSMTPIRSSPRLSKTVVDKEMPTLSTQKVVEEVFSPKETSLDDSLQNTTSSTEKTAESTSSQDDSIKSSDSTLPKLRPRRSLCRKVLETNALNRALSSPVASPRSRRRTENFSQNQNLAKSELTSPLTPRRSLFGKSRQEVTKIEENTETVESTLKYVDGEESHKSSFTKRHNLTTSFVESDSDTSGDFAFNTDVSLESVLPSPLLRLIKSGGKSVLDETGLVEEMDDEKNDDTEETFEAAKTLQVSGVPDVEQKDNQEQGQEDNESMRAEQKENGTHDKSIEEYRTTTSDRDQSAYSVYDSSCSDYFNVSYRESGPKFSESMMRCIYDGDGEEKADKTSNEDDEVMEVDEVVEIDEEPDRDNETVQIEDLPTTNLKEVENKEESQKKQSAESSPENKDSSKEEVSDGGSSNRTVDPEMNVFEISDDLSINNGVVVEKEITFEENDLCYDQQNTLESVLEENITSALDENISVTDTPLKVLEKNVFDESFEEPGSSEEESEVDVSREVNESFEDSEDAEEESDVHEVQEENSSDREMEETRRLDETKPVEIIEIGSSSDENEERIKEESFEYDSERSYQHGESDEEKLEVSYERNIYDTEDDYSSESSYERRYSEVSENSDDSQASETKPGELFHGDIILVSDQKENEASNDDDDDDDEEESSEARNIKTDEDTKDKPKRSNEEDKSVEIIEDRSKKDEAMAEEVEDQALQSKLFGEGRTVCVPDEECEVKDVEVDNNRTLRVNQTEVSSGLFDGDILFEERRDEVKDEAKGEVNRFKQSKGQRKHDTVLSEIAEEKEDESLPSVKPMEESKNEEENAVNKAANTEENRDERLPPVKHLEESEDQRMDTSTKVDNTEEGEKDNLSSVKHLKEFEDREQDTVMMTENIEEKGDQNVPTVEHLEESKDQEEDTAETTENPEGEDQNLISGEQLEKSKDQDEYIVTIAADENPPSVKQLQGSTDQEKRDIVKAPALLVKERKGDKKLDEYEQENGRVDRSSDDKGTKEDRKVEEASLKSRDPVDTSPQKLQENEESTADAPNPRTRSNSNSTKAAKRTRQKSTDVSEEGLRRSTRRTKEDSTNKLDTGTDDASKSQSTGDSLDSELEGLRRSRRTKEVGSKKPDTETDDASRSKADVDSMEVDQEGLKRATRKTKEVGSKTSDTKADDASVSKGDESDPEGLKRSTRKSQVVSSKTSDTKTDDVGVSKGDESDLEGQKRATRKSKVVSSKTSDTKTDDVSVAKGDESGPEGLKGTTRKSKIVSSKTSDTKTDDASVAKVDESDQEDVKHTTRKTKVLGSKTSDTKTDDAGVSKGDESDPEGLKRTTRKTKVVGSKTEDAGVSKGDESDQEGRKRSTRRTKEVSSKKSDQETDDAIKSKSVVDSLALTPVRNLRSRRVSTEESASPALTLRKRSASVDETKITPKESVKKEKEPVAEKSRSKRAASASRLPQIAEESDAVKHVERKRSRSVLESYSPARRVTRQQLNMLKKVEGEGVSSINLNYLDPIVFMDRLPFEGKPDPEEKKVYDTSPPSSDGAPMTTRRRARSASVSSVNSNDSNVSETRAAAKRRTRQSSQSVLPGIEEEPSSEKPAVPKKRTRKNSSQK